MPLTPIRFHIPAEPYVTVPAADQESYAIPGVTREDFRGLVVNKEIDRASTPDSIRFKTTYCVSHEASGSRVLGGFPRQSDAIAAAAFLGPQLDWTRSAHELRAMAAEAKPFLAGARRAAQAAARRRTEDDD